MVNAPKITMPPTVSILIPVYNRKRYIKECIQSAIDQTFTDFEIVIVDNASDDGTWETCQQFAAKDPRIRTYRNEENIGPVRNWKRCAEEARGEFSKILFSDDTLEPDCLSQMVPRLDDLDISLVFCAARIGPSRDDAVIAYSLGENSRVNFKEYLRLVLEGKAPVSPGAILIRTTDLLANLHIDIPTATPRPFAKHGAGPDVLISILTAESYAYVQHVPLPLVYFRAHAGSFSIANTNNEVGKGYTSAISYYLSKKFNNADLISYLAISWLKEMRNARVFINPQKYLRGNEGSGSLTELFIMFFYAAKHLRKSKST